MPRLSTFEAKLNVAPALSDESEIADAELVESQSEIEEINKQQDENDQA